MWHWLTLLANIFQPIEGITNVIYTVYVSTSSSSVTLNYMTVVDKLMLLQRVFQDISIVLELTRQEQPFGCDRLRILPAFSRQNHLYPAMLGLEVFHAGDCNTYISICILYNRCNNGPVYEIKQPIHCAKVKLPCYRLSISDEFQILTVNLDTFRQCNIVIGCR